MEHQKGDMQSKKQQFQDFDSKLRSEFIKINKKAAYGTAGFRDLAENMPYIVLRVGVFVAILNKTAPSKSLGIVVSASHNKKEDNGLKITNFKGNMLEREYQSQIQEFVNQENLEKAIKNFKSYLVKKELTIFETKVIVLIGGDTRPSTSQFLSLLAKGIESEGGKAINFNLTTTPQLQFYVNYYNFHVKPKNLDNDIEDPQEIRSSYWKVFSERFINCAKYIGWEGVVERTVDCANGVGGRILPEFMKEVEGYFKIELKNHNNDEYLNRDCGADYVKTNRLFPREFQSKEHNSFASFDGDADRIVYYIEDNSKLCLIDGDRIGTILTQFFKKLVEELKQKTNTLNQNQNVYFNLPINPTTGFVQTYYANYSSSEYLKQKYNMDPVYAATGVKNLHEKAEHLDIGVYFEGNGHGTVIFKDQYLNKLDALVINKSFLLESEMITKNQNVKKHVEKYFQFVEFYLNVCRLLNPTVGDAITVLLLFEIALKYLKINYKDTLNLYTDLEYQTSKIAVKTKENLKVTDIQDKVVSPEGLQKTIEEIIQKHKGKKAFLRASGTEDVVRLHVEASTKDQVESIAKEVRQLVMCCKELN